MQIAQNLLSLKEQIRETAIEAGRNPEDIRLVAVSKTKPLSMIEEAVACGQRDFGENRPQELSEKFQTLPQVFWHQIGQLQKNKVRHIIDKATLIHSVDTFSLAQEIEKRAAAIHKVQDILIQVNISGEESKSGVSPEDAAALCREISALSHVHILGLMTISVQGMTEEENFRLFFSLKQLSVEIEKLKIPNVEMKELSMGMTHDYIPAIRAGATLLRIGSGIFGARDTQTL